MFYDHQRGKLHGKQLPRSSSKKNEEQIESYLVPHGFSGRMMTGRLEYMTARGELRNNEELRALGGLGSVRADKKSNGGGTMV